MAASDLALMQDEKISKIQIFHIFLLTFIRVAYIIILVRDMVVPNKKQEANKK